MFRVNGRKKQKKKNRIKYFTQIVVKDLSFFFFSGMMQISDAEMKVFVKKTFCLFEGRKLQKFFIVN